MLLTATETGTRVLGDNSLGLGVLWERAMLVRGRHIPCDGGPLSHWSGNPIILSTEDYSRREISPDCIHVFFQRRLLYHGGRNFLFTNYDAQMGSSSNCCRNNCGRQGMDAPSGSNPWEAARSPDYSIGARAVSRKRRTY
jgi:hypothetical protein